ncbi:MAG TPA: MarR family winged helix-turn-helix transcriptional regulator, partial [Acidothermaceae bacterium]
LAVGGDQPHNIGEVLAEQPLPVAPATLSVVATSIPTPRQAFSGLGRAVINTSITLAAMLALTFPSQLFNRTFEENYDEILAITRRRFGRPGARTAAEEATRSKRHTIVVFSVVVAAGSLIGSLRDPGFGANTRSVLTFIATGLALLVAAATAYLVGRTYRARVHAGISAQLRALPAGLLVAALCVAVSRIAHFQPGYLYGVVCGAVFAGSLKRRELGQLTMVSSLAMLVISVAAWFIWVPVNHAATHHNAFVGVVLLDDVLASIFVAGITGTVISLLPLRFMPGQALYSWHRGVWAATFGVATFGLVEILLRPSTQAVTHPGNIAWATAAVLFIIFGIGSLAFREYFARHVPTDQQRIGLGAAVITALLADGDRSENELAQRLSVEASHLHATVDRLERAGWLRREKVPHAPEADAPLHLSAAANALRKSQRIGRFTRQRLILALTRTERTALADLLQPSVRPDPHAGSQITAAESDRSPTKES